MNMDTTGKISNRPPIVTIMGHVDHGKTTLLDTIRKTNVAAGEHGGITQHIGAYQITHESKLITFVDTPGHAAFEKMRSRGAEVADIVILTVAANDSVKPQTIEAIKHIQKAQKPTIVAITKTDLPDINIERVKKELQGAGIVVDTYGGDVPVVEVAAPKGKGINELLEVIELVWQMNPQPSLPDEPLEAVVVESFLDKSRGAIVTVIVKQGMLRVGQKINVDGETITVKALIDDNGKSVKDAEPAKPVEILGFKKTLEVGSIVTDTISQKHRQDLQPATYADIIAKSENVKNKFKIILKADVSGSLEAILENLPKNALILDSSVGEITNSDIAFAKTAKAPIIAFNLKIPNSIKNQAEREGVVIRPYNVIYELLQDIEDVVIGFEEAKIQAKITGKAKIIATFAIEGKKIAGAKVTNGRLNIGDQVNLVRGEKILGSAKISSIKRFKKDFQTVSGGQDCGIGLEPELDFQQDDVIESFGSSD
ncbi:translation initiation factor IF-2 [Candidatus Curtissbacteria bacterium RIFCSPHIGHO2_01_FULL_41_11]|uniref:Translation initiation factor IF-2 n=1 Tax=Candidatus Curtissbacteria bacterium RIFCSPHIGHO2_01_FULL_41_11 TaxID=1797711 RepID=A0A1F5G3Q0_9BACT|nr:MAG: translation initiation factor IF-2 [Candidatus Curtissbacteria bacterium RIFCSPHIGHO2_01_FULL_41_11]